MRDVYFNAEYGNGRQYLESRIKGNEKENGQEIAACFADIPQDDTVYSTLWSLSDGRVGKTEKGGIQSSARDGDSS